MKEHNNKPKVRFAPSPTGPLHIGGVRTALYNYLFARHFGGTMLLRIEDTDSKRFVPGAEEYIIEALHWLGIEIDEGVGVGGNAGPYRQSERRDIYRKYVEQLLKEGKAYKAYDTPEELDEKRKVIPNFQYDASTRMSMKNSLTLSKEEASELEKSGVAYAVRILIEPGEEVEVNDLIRGKVVINSSILDDKVLYKSADDLPTYHLANIVDDHLMGITHVIRGEEWLPSAPLHKLLYRALGWEEEMPQFAHLALLLKPDGNGKLSKRDGDRLGFPVFPLEWHDPQSGAISTGYRESGYLPDALINFLALLGWNPGDDREILSREELIAAFNLEHCSKSGAKFDFEKARWFNQHYIRQASTELLVDVLKSQLQKKGITPSHDLSKIVKVVQERITLLPDLLTETLFFFERPTSYDSKTVKKRWKDQSAAQMKGLQEKLQALEDFSEESIDNCIKEYITSHEYGMGAVMNVLRLLLVGDSKGPHLHEIIAILGKEETIERIENGVKALSEI